MRTIHGTTKAQTIFLRECIADPLGMGGRRLPGVTQFRKWMRRPGFCAALATMRETLDLQTDLHLAAAATAAARGIAQTVAGESSTRDLATEDSSEQTADGAAPAPAILDSNSQKHLASLVALLRLTNARERLAGRRLAALNNRPRRVALPPGAKKAIEELQAWASCGAHDNTTIGTVKQFLADVEAAGLVESSAEATEATKKW